MDVELIQMEPAAAKAKLVAYRKAIAARAHSTAATQATKEYAEIENAYKSLAKGLPLIELSKAMAMGGWKADGRPAFAVARANTKTVECHTGHNNELCFSRPQGRYCYNKSFGTFQFALSRMPPPPREPSVGGSALAWRGGCITAIVPIVPPDVLPRADIDLSKRVILWEADWQQAPVDPLLLLPIGGDLYAVEAAWDLTPLERAVIQSRRE